MNSNERGQMRDRYQSGERLALFVERQIADLMGIVDRMGRYVPEGWEGLAGIKDRMAEVGMDMTTWRHGEAMNALRVQLKEEEG